MSAAKGMGIELGTPTSMLPGPSSLEAQGGPLVSPRPCSRVGVHAAATRIMAGRAASSVPCPVCFGIGAVECLPSLAVLPAPRRPIQNTEPRAQDAECRQTRTEQGKARHAGTKPTRPPVVRGGGVEVPCQQPVAGRGRCRFQYCAYKRHRSDRCSG